MGMKAEVWNMADGRKLEATAPKRRPKSVVAILRAAYRRFSSDPATRRAVRRCLP